MDFMSIHSALVGRRNLDIINYLQILNKLITKSFFPLHVLSKGKHIIILLRDLSKVYS